MEIKDTTIYGNLTVTGKITAKGISGGGNYESLTNKPKINNVELIGNKSLSDIGVNDTTVIFKQGVGFTKQITLNQGEPTTINFPNDYESLNNLPKINNTELKGNKNVVLLSPASQQDGNANLLSAILGGVTYDSSCFQRNASGTHGSITLPNGLTLKYGRMTITSGGADFEDEFVTPFEHAILAVIGSPRQSASVTYMQRYEFRESGLNKVVFWQKSACITLFDYIVLGY